MYLLSPFAARLVPSDAAFAAAGVGFMALGAANTFLVGLVSVSLRSTRRPAAGLRSCVWIVAVRVGGRRGDRPAERVLPWRRWH